MSAKWIWYRGEFEAYHNLMLHSRRESFGMPRPPFWDVPGVYPFVEFEKTFVVERAGSFVCRAKGTGLVCLDGVFYPLETAVPVQRGKHTVSLKIGNHGGLPCIFIDSDVLITDESWTVTHGGAAPVSAGCVPSFLREDDDPQVFPFAYERFDAGLCEKTSGGLLFDFGKELFGKLVIRNLCPQDSLCIYYGESREEAESGKEWGQCTLWEDVCGKEEVTLIPRAFRYIRIEGSSVDDVEVHALYEYLPLEIRGGFSCSEESIKRIWDVCAYTFHLCSREFFIDGVKRDRWVWSGDARQSFMINDYIFADPEICKRTILALLPKDRVFQHVNTINDYSAFLIISVWEFFLSFGDAEFVRFVFPRVRMLYDFIVSRLDENGLVVKRERDWIFIDWAPMDKDGPIAAEQILLWQAHECMAKLSEAIGFDGSAYTDRAKALRKTILDLYWNEERQAFIDTFGTGKDHVTRHANIFAILFDFVDDVCKDRIDRSVLQNDAIPAITTPYFKLYEMMAICSLGHLETAQKLLGSYWGGMLRLGATTMWEEFKPEQEIPACYAMYGEDFGKSLCHAWSSGPIYFLGRFCLGVKPTAPGYRTYTVAPNPGIYSAFEGDVPTVRGKIHVSYRDGEIRVLSELDGGTLIWNGKEYPIEKNKEVRV